MAFSATVERPRWPIGNGASNNGPVGGVGNADGMELDLTGEIFYWRGPAPYHYIRVPGPESTRLRSVAKDVTYGWGMIPVLATMGDTEWETSLFPKDGGYLIPIKDAVRDAEGVDDGDVVTIRLTVALPE
jgi:hypothetical protein